MASLEQNIQKFKFDLLRKMPFYGDVVMRLRFTETTSVPVAATNGRDIMYNPDYMNHLAVGEQNFVLMHEILHIMLLHCKRGIGKNRDIWNISCDIMVNGILSELQYSIRRHNIPFERPRVGIFEDISSDDDAENIYAKICESNKETASYKYLWLTDKYNSPKKVRVQHDIVYPRSGNEKTDVLHRKQTSNGLRAEDAEDAFNNIETIIRESMAKNRSDAGNYFIPKFFLKLVQSRQIKWSDLLKSFLTEQISDDVSYTTPERKYIHMDLILPGHSMSEETIEEVWAFVDSSGSIGNNELNQFLTQLYRIVKSFHCKLHICYWDTQVTDVYKNVTSEKGVLECVPHHSGGTDINCIYHWIRTNNVKPSLMLILTDGFFGTISDYSIVRKYKQKTIMVLSRDISDSLGDIHEKEDLKAIGRIVRL